MNQPHNGGQSDPATEARRSLEAVIAHGDDETLRRVTSVLQDAEDRTTVVTAA